MENQQLQTDVNEEVMSYDRFRQEVLQDFRVAMISRETSLLGRREVLTGKAKFWYNINQCKCSKE